MEVRQRMVAEKLTVSELVTTQLLALPPVVQVRVSRPAHSDFSSNQALWECSCGFFRATACRRPVNETGEHEAALPFLRVPAEGISSCRLCSVLHHRLHVIMTMVRFVT